jgi:hypothetical protein
MVGWSVNTELQTVSKEAVMSSLKPLFLNLLGGTGKFRERGTSVSRLLQTVCSYLLTLVPRSRIFLPWRWRRYVPPKRRFTQDLHGATSQKTAFFSLQPPAHAGSSLADFSTLKVEAIRSSKTSVHPRSTRRHIPEDAVLHNQRLFP